MWIVGFVVIAILNIVLIFISINKNKNVIGSDELTDLNNQLTRHQVEKEHLLKEQYELSNMLELEKQNNNELRKAFEELTIEKNSLLIQLERFNIENTNLKQAYTQLENILEQLRKDLNQEFVNLKNQAISDLKIEASSSLRTIGKDELVEPLSKTLRQLQADIIKLQAETSTMNKSSTELNMTAQSLADALVKDSKKKGDFGELILANILESVGLKDKISYLEQERINFNQDVHIPDLIINLPENRALIVDSKNIVGGYYDSLSKDEDGSVVIRKALERALTDLASKKYAEALEYKLGKQVFEYLVLFIPNEGLFNQILHQEHQSKNSLIDIAYKQKIIIAGPSTILLLVAIIDKMWRTAETDERASQIIKLANDLCIKFKTTVDNLGKLGNSLKSSVNNYNDLIGSFDNGDSRSALNKLTQLAGYKDIVKTIEPLEDIMRVPASIS